MEHLTIDAADDDDFYRFTADGDGQLTVELEFLDRLGDVDLDLLDSAGAIVATSRSSNDNESISFPQIPAKHSSFAFMATSARRIPNTG